jgi:hypothetical protein
MVTIETIKIIVLFSYFEIIIIIVTYNFQINKNEKI